MPSALYSLLQGGFKHLSAWQLRQALITGEIHLLDPHEHGPYGPLLHQALSIDRPSGRNWSLEKDDGRFSPDIAHENLVLWLIEQGADPWLNHNGVSAWREAIWRGWPRAIETLRQHPSAPPKEVLESERMSAHDGLQSQAVASHWPHAPALFARHNQGEALKAWARAGLDVNLGIGHEGGAGHHAISAAFIKQWGEVGGDLTREDPVGRPLPEAWSHLSVQHRLPMEKLWQAAQKVQQAPIDQRITALLKACRVEGRTMVTHHFRVAGLKPASVDTTGVTVRQRWLEEYVSSPLSYQASTVAFLLESASAAEQDRAVIAGLKTATAKERMKFPTPDHLTKLLKAAPSEDRPQRLKSWVLAAADGRLNGFHRMLEVGKEWTGLWPESENSLPSERLAAAWLPWFEESVNAEGDLLVWKAFGVWMKATNLRTLHANDGTYEFWRAFVSKASPATLRQGAHLLGLADRLQKGGSPRTFWGQWHPSSESPWTARLDHLWPSQWAPTERIFASVLRSLEKEHGANAVAEFSAMVQAQRLREEIASPAPAVRRPASRM